MQVMYKRLDHHALTIDRSAAALGLDEFSLLSRIQTGEVIAGRARSGEMVLPERELARLAACHADSQSVEGGAILPDECLGIERRYGALRPNGESALPYKVGDRHFSEDEINGYRAAASAIATQLKHAKDLNGQLSSDGQLLEASDPAVNLSDTERWEVRSALLKLDHGQVLLCQRGDEFAVIERFRDDSLYAQANGNAQMLWKGGDAPAVVEAFKADARQTLEFMASNLVAKAQKVVWEQYPDHRPAQIVAAISERCRQAIANEATISQKRKVTNSARHGIAL